MNDVWTMATVVKIAAVPYPETIPFIYGIRHEDNFAAELSLSSPADCIERYSAGQADMALVPATAVPELKGAQIISEYCIASSGPFRSALLASDSPLNGIARIMIDPAAVASVQLAGRLCRDLWKISPEWIALDTADGLAASASAGDAFLLTGENADANRSAFRYSYDLAAAWNETAGQPFCFAVWVARKGTPYAVTDTLQHTLTFGIEHTYEAIAESGAENVCDTYEYLTRDIDYLFDEQKHKALKKFWDAGIKIVPRVNPG